jgi:leucyl/phenylalanyl-tRNA---protein transferase
MARSFPDPESADDQGLVTVTPKMTPELVLEAYASGIFPWSSRPVRWYSPDPRAIFLRERIHLPRKLKRDLRRGGFRVTFDTAFVDVIRACAERHAREGVWITDEFVRTYAQLHERGYAHSVEVWHEAELVGGLYGIQIRGLYAGESMFYRAPNASKVAFAYLVRQLDRLGIVLFDAQVINEHTHRLGAVLVHRSDYLQLLRIALGAEVPDGAKWPAEPPPWDEDVTGG